MKRNAKHKPVPLHRAEDLYFGAYDFPLGKMLILCEGGAVVGVHFWDGALTQPERRSPLTDAAAAELAAYFAGQRERFDLPLCPYGSLFQRAVWTQLQRIPYGQARTYGQIAKYVGKPGAARAVGAACNRNPIAIMIPCHRVVGADGSLIGYAGGLQRKKRLLELEGCLVPPPPDCE